MRILSSILALILLCCLKTGLLSAQAYWQQEVDYLIKVSLNDSAQTLDGHITMYYTNNSPNSLPFIYINLMPNAYMGKQSALNNQLLADEEYGLQFTNSIYKGYISNLAWTVNGDSASSYSCGDTVDIHILKLPAPIKPGETIRIETPFLVKLPSTHISRMGFKNSAYYITQWYPKPAVYDVNGWHPLSYLDKGEFFSEFGDYEVQITVPENFVIAATGELITEVEIHNIDTLAEFSSNYVHPKRRKDLKKEIEASHKMKTLAYRISNVHDFAFCADPEFLVMKDTIHLEGEPIILQTFVKMSHWNDWKKANKYLEEALRFYDEEIGPYPYKNFSVVDVDDITGGNMEYPTIAWINNSYSIEESIVHEVGHNWFYGVLGSNERDEPWLDEGINTFYENKFLQKKYPDARVHFNARYLDGNVFPFYQESHTEYYSLARLNRDQPSKTTSHLLSSANYFAISYSKPAAYLSYLQSICGEKVFSDVVKEYYATWKFKHPSASDLQEIFKAKVGKNADWFFDEGMITNEKINYEIKNVKKSGEEIIIEIHNKGDIAPPIYIQTYNSNFQLTGTNEFEPINIKGNVAIQYNPEIKWITLDKGMTIPDMDLNNNYVAIANGKKKLKPTRFNLLTSFENPFRKHIYYVPGVTYNYYDGVQVGMILHNYGLLPKATEWFILPMFASQSIRPSFMGAINHIHYLKRNNPDRMVLNIAGNFQSYNQVSGVHLWSVVLGSHLKFIFDRRDIYSPISHEVGSKNQLVVTQVDPGLSLNNRVKFLMQNIVYYKLNFKKRLWEIQNISSFEHTNDFGINRTVGEPVSNIPSLKLYNEFKVVYTYFKNKSTIQFRLFAGTFLITPDMVSDTRFRLSGWRGIWDYGFNEYYLARSEPTGFFSQQVAHADGDFKINTYLGQSNFWLMAANLEWDVPSIYAGVYMDIGTFQYAGASATDPTFVYNGGFFLRTPDRTLQVYFPFISSTDIAASVDLNTSSYWERIRFTVQLQNFQFIKNIRKLFI